MCRVPLGVLLNVSARRGITCRLGPVFPPKIGRQCGGNQTARRVPRPARPFLIANAVVHSVEEMGVMDEETGARLKTVPIKQIV